MNDVTEDTGDIEEVEDLDPQEQAYEEMCEIAEQYLAHEGCHDRGAKAAVRAMCRTLVFKGEDLEEDGDEE